MIPELLQNIVGSVMRHALTGLGGLLIAQGWVTEGDWERLPAYWKPNRRTRKW